MEDKNNTVLQPGVNIKPELSTEDASSIVEELYGIRCTNIEEMIAYDDMNYKISVKSCFNKYIDVICKEGYVLKIMNSLDSLNEDLVDAQLKMMMFLVDSGINCPTPVKNLQGKYYYKYTIKNKVHIIRMLEYQKGLTLYDIECDDRNCREMGILTARIDQTLKEFHHPVFITHKTVWMLDSVPQLRDFLHVITDTTKNKMVSDVIDEFEKEVLTKTDRLEKGVIHGDLNPNNIIITPLENDLKPQKWKISSVIDFGDVQSSCILFECAIAMTYLMMNSESVEKGGVFLEGYTTIRKLTNLERNLLKICICARLAQSLVLGLYTHSLNPKNEYILISQQYGWQLLEKLLCISNEDLFKLWKFDEL